MRIVYRYSIGNSEVITLSPKSPGLFNASIGVFLCSNASGGNLIISQGANTGGAWAVQYALDRTPELYQGSVVQWFDHPYMSGPEGTGMLSGNIAFPVAAIRLVVSTLPTGAPNLGFALMSLQAGQPG